MTGRARSLLVVTLLTPVLVGCAVIKPINDYALPGGKATGSDGYTVSAVFTNINNLVPNSQVLYNDVAVGSVRSISVQDWRAHVTFRVLKRVHLPANVTAKIGQKSLLGAEYLELDDPAAAPPSGQLAAGDVIPLTRTGQYPETEQVLSAVALLLNNGGLPQIKTITSEVNTMLRGSSSQRSVQNLITDLNTFVSSLDAQKQQILDAIQAVDRLAGTLSQQRAAVARAIDAIDPGLSVLNAQRSDLTTALEALGRFGQIGTEVIRQAGPGLATDLAKLEPILTNLAKAGNDLPKSLEFLVTYPWPLRNVDRVFRGDYANIFVTIDLTLEELKADWLAGPTASGSNADPGLQAKNPITAPIAAATGSSTRSTSAPKPATTSTPSAHASSTGAPAPAPACPWLQHLLGGC